MAHKKVKIRFNFLRLFTLLLIGYLFVCVTYKIINEPIRNIIISGNNLVTDNEIIELANIKDYPALFTLNTSKLKESVKSNPLISEVDVKKNLKFQLRINVKELKIICLDIINNKLLLEDGTSTTNNNMYQGIPSLINYTPEDTLKELLKSMGELDYGTISGISEIEYSPSKNKNNEVMDDTRFLLKMNDGNTVYINIYTINKLKNYQKIYANLNEKGILHLDSGDYLEVNK